MNRKIYIDFVEEKLNFLSYRIKKRGAINLLDLNIYSETFFAELLNHLLNYKLININQIKQNTEGIDLIDNTNKILVQVSATCTKQKIQKALEKEIFNEYPDYRFKFIAISEEADKLRKLNVQNPHQVNFDPVYDIYDIKSLLNIVLNKPIQEMYTLYEFIKKELGNEISIEKVDTNLAAIINILSKEDFSRITESPEINSFEIEKKIDFNKLITVRSTINEHKVYYSRLDEKYKEFDRQGANKSLSVFSVLRNQYVKLLNRDLSPHELFFTIISNVISIVRDSKNYIEIPFEELEMCVSILVVDSFIRCKIFENPEGYCHVAT
jgi:hypothetical protein